MFNPASGGTSALALPPQVFNQNLSTPNTARTPLRSLAFASFNYEVNQPTTMKRKSLSLHEWPWRGFAFASDLGTIGYLVKKPGLGLLGWLVATPYYLLAIASQPAGQSRQEEIIYQSTANGIFPIAEAKAGAVTAEWLFNKTKPLLEKQLPHQLFSKISLPVYKVFGSLGAMLVLTPWFGDPISHWCVKTYHKWSGQKNKLPEAGKDSRLWIHS